MLLDGTPHVSNPAGNGAQGVIVGIAIHHTVGVNLVQTEEEERATIKRIDLQHKANPGWGGFGYHGIVFPSGRAYHCGEGRRAHVEKRNHELRGWAFSGTFTTEQPTGLAWEGMKEALLWERRLAPIPVAGHRELTAPGTGGTICPGAIVPFDWETWLAPPARVVVGIGLHFADGSEREAWNPANDAGKVLDGVGLRLDDGTVIGVWP